MSSPITPLLALPEDLLEKNIYNYLGKGSISVLHGTRKKLYLDHQDKASAETPLLKLNDFSLSKISSFMSLGEKLKLSRTNSTMRSKWMHLLLGISDLIRIIPIIGNIHTDMSPAQEKMLKLYIKIAQNIITNSSRAPNITHEQTSFESYYHLMVNPVKLTLLLKFFPGLINPGELLEEALSTSPFSSLPKKISLYIALSHPLVLSQSEQLSGFRSFDIESKIVPLIIQNAINKGNNLESATETIQALYALLPPSSMHGLASTIELINLIKRVYEMRADKLINQNKFEILKKHIEISLNNIFSIIARKLYLGSIIDLYTKFENQTGSEIDFPSKIDLISRLKEISLLANKDDYSSFSALWNPNSELRGLSNIEDRIKHHIQRYRKLYAGRHQEKLHGAIAILKTNLNYLYFLQLNALNAPTSERPQSNRDFLREFQKFKQDLQEHEDKVSELDQDRFDRELNRNHPTAFGYIYRDEPPSEPLIGPANRVVTKSCCFGFFKIAQTIPFSRHHYDDRLVIGDRFSIRLPDD